MCHCICMSHLENHRNNSLSSSVSYTLHVRVCEHVLLFHGFSVCTQIIYTYLVSLYTWESTSCILKSGLKNPTSYHMCVCGAGETDSVQKIVVGEFLIGLVLIDRKRQLKRGFLFSFSFQSHSFVYCWLVDWYFLRPLENTRIRAEEIKQNRTEQSRKKEKRKQEKTNRRETARQIEIEKKAWRHQHQKMFMDCFDFTVAVVVIIINVSAAARASRFPIGVVIFFYH